ncbi:hypothetical protein MWU49_14590 [Alcanivorax sp. S6407]|uniref:hypothetical protein n=1 Tax=Alcanivorax sp. S6407 TaxID=2926424 RepID=UPI001FF48D67|nr:hypothetical protein [Alcanivorax sp. S6407]MCK0154941.1 hypothetical protein [Alcanivorax sp. S6407]
MDEETKLFVKLQASSYKLEHGQVNHEFLAPCPRTTSTINRGHGLFPPKGLSRVVACSLPLHRLQAGSYGNTKTKKAAKESRLFLFSLLTIHC